jgi:hypothetical protein
MNESRNRFLPFGSRAMLRLQRSSVLSLKYYVTGLELLWMQNDSEISGAY